MYGVNSKFELWSLWRGDEEGIKDLLDLVHTFQLFESRKGSEGHSKGMSEL